MPTTRSATASSKTITPPGSGDPAQSDGGAAVRREPASATDEDGASAAMQVPTPLDVTEDEWRVSEDEFNADMAAFGIDPRGASKKSAQLSQLATPTSMYDHAEPEEDNTQPKIHEIWQKARMLRYGDTVRLTWNVVLPYEMDDDREVVLVYESNERETSAYSTLIGKPHLSANDEKDIITTFTRKRRASTSIEGPATKKMALNADSALSTSN